MPALVARKRAPTDECPSWSPASGLLQPRSALVGVKACVLLGHGLQHAAAELRVFGQDLRADDGDGDMRDERGVFAMYMDLLYDANGEQSARLTELKALWARLAIPAMPCRKPLCRNMKISAKPYWIRHLRRWLRS